MKSLSCAATAAGCLLVASAASAEVSLGKVGDWEVFTTGRVNAFIVNISGDGYPVDAMGMQSTTIAGGGITTPKDRVVDKKDAMGMPLPGEQGSVSKWRVLSGYIPNILSLGVRSQVSEDFRIKGVVALWGSIETGGQRKTEIIHANFNEGYLQLDGSWGMLTGGRMLSLFSRGSYEMHYLYGYRYGAGAQVALSVNAEYPNSSTGLVGFGVPAAAYNPGVYYTTPSLGGLRLNVGLFDPIRVSQSTWDRTETPRPEFEVTYDLASEGFATHVFVNGAYQKVYKANNSKESDSLLGVAGGLRLEFGPVHVGASAHTGKGVGLGEAFVGDIATLAGPGDMMNPVTMQPIEKLNELRSFDGFALFLQYAAGTFDVNLAFGQSRAHQLDIDKAKIQVNPAAARLIKSQTGIGLGFVFHATENLHLDIDYLRAMYRWYGGPKQDMNFINAGATIDW